MDTQLLELLDKKLAERLDTLITAVADGVADTLNDYRHLTGQIHGLRIARSEINDLVRRMENDDDE